MKRSPVRVLVALQDVRSAHNVGSIFRTADAAGATGLCLIGTTPTPLDRFGRPQKDIAKTALGAEQTVPWTYYATIEDFIEAMRRENVQLVAIEQDTRAVDYKTFSLERDTVLTFGHEVDGVGPTLLDAADVIAHIPMKGEKESLNVSVAAGIVLYRFLDTPI